MAPGMPITFDGMDYMRFSIRSEMAASNRIENFALVDDYNIIRWLQENVQGTPVIMEGVSVSEYQWGNRISIYTGLPSIVGWRWHQVQQRTFAPMPTMVEMRHANVNAFYSTSDIYQAWEIIQFYDVEYIIVSGLERARYEVRANDGSILYSGLTKFETMVELGLLEVVYAEGQGVIYHVVPNAGLGEQVESTSG
jgi:uncharacterized membrane protein